MKEVLLPEGNVRDVAELPGHILEGLEIHHVSRYDEVFGTLFP